MIQKNNFGDIKGGQLFPFHFQIVAVAFAIGGLAALATYPVLAIVLFMIAA